MQKNEQKNLEIKRTIFLPKFASVRICFYLLWGAKKKKKKRKKKVFDILKYFIATDGEFNSLT